MTLIPPKFFGAVAFVLTLIGTDDLSHSCSHRYFTQNLTFAFVFAILKLSNSEIVSFRFALIFVSMVIPKTKFMYVPFSGKVSRLKYPPYCETGVAIPLSHCVSCDIADYCSYTPTSFLKNGLSQSKERANKGASQEKLASKAYRAIGGIARNSIANRTIVGH